MHNNIETFIMFFSYISWYENSVKCIAVIIHYPLSITSFVLLNYTTQQNNYTMKYLCKCFNKMYTTFTFKQIIVFFVTSAHF